MAVCFLRSQGCLATEGCGADYSLNLSHLIWLTISRDSLDKQLCFCHGLSSPSTDPGQTAGLEMPALSEQHSLTTLLTHAADESWLKYVMFSEYIPCLHILFLRSFWCWRWHICTLFMCLVVSAEQGPREEPRKTKSSQLLQGLLSVNCSWGVFIIFSSTATFLSFKTVLMSDVLKASLCSPPHLNSQRWPFRACFRSKASSFSHVIFIVEED